MKKNLLILLSSFYFLSFYASSPQIPDYIIFNKDTLPTYNLLVERYLQTKKEDKGKLFNLSFRNPIEGLEGSYSNCWRGYQAIYSIENGKLFVEKIIKCYSLKKKNSKNYLLEVFGEKVKNNRVLVDWFSGNLSFPIIRNDNKQIRWDGVFERIFMFETVVKIKKGNVVEISEEKNYTDLKNGINRANRDSINNILFNSIKNYKWNKVDKIDCGESYTVEIGKNGKISKILLTHYQHKDTIAEYFNLRGYKFCIKSIKKALKNLQFDIIKNKGTPIEEKFIIEIWFNEDGTIENWTN